MNIRLNSSIAGTLFAATVLLWGSGCSSVRQEPFTKFNDAVKNTQTAVEAAGAVCQTFSSDGFATRFIASGKTPKTLKIEVDRENILHPWSMPLYSSDPAVLPTYLEMKRALIAVETLNLFFSQYTELLKTLADPSLVSTENFDALTNQARATGEDAWAALNPKADSATTAEAAAVNSLLADLTGDLWRKALKEKQVKLLREILQQNQPAIKAYADHGAAHVNTLMNVAENYYKDKICAWEKEWPGEDELKTAEILQKILKLNEQYINVITVLVTLKQSYRNLPPAYADLIVSLDDEHKELDALKRFYYFSRRLQILVDCLKK